MLLIYLSTGPNLLPFLDYMLKALLMDLNGSYTLYMRHKGIRGKENQCEKPEDVATVMSY